ncbi:MAG: 5'-nucleotidase C-terminal domain-containing protein [Pelosinus sp.]|nr:5'-nucleotidase C-terminal domain-containing protein [Pelosinus sp.]
MQLRKYVLTVALAAILFAAAVYPVTAAVHGDQVVLTILTVNDFHGALAEAPGKNPGAAKLAAFLLSEKAKDPAGTLIVSGGDMFQGSVDSNLLYGQPVIDVMNYVGFDAMVLGNHEFDWGIAKLVNLKSAARFPMGADNVLDNQTQKLPLFAVPDKDAKLPCTLLARDGIKVGVIYLATPETAILTNPNVVGAYTFKSPAETVRILAPQLRKAGAEVVIVLSHLGSQQDVDTKVITGAAADLANQLPRGLVDAIVSAHTHLSIAGTVSGIPIVEAHHNGWQIGEIHLTYSKAQHKVIETDESYIDLRKVSDLAPDIKAKTIIDKYQNAIAAQKNTTLGKAAYPLSHQRFASNLSVLGQWATDVVRKRTNADFAFQNDGGLRTSLPAGTITMGNLYEVLPFDNNVIMLSLTGEQIKNMLEYGIQNKAIGMLQFSGATVEYAPAQMEGSRVVAVTLLNGEPLDSRKTYKVVVNDFMAAGGDGYSMFKQGRAVKDTGLTLRDVLCEAIQTAGMVTFCGDDRLVIK